MVGTENATHLCQCYLDRDLVQLSVHRAKIWLLVTQAVGDRSFVSEK